MYYLCRSTFMKEQLESNLLTKYAAGLMNSDELNTLEDWLKKNPQYRSTLAVIKQRVDAMVNAVSHKQMVVSQ